MPEMLTIAMVNNMPPAALKSTERQFQAILSEAAQGIAFTIQWFRLSGARPDSYGSLSDLLASQPDGMIVTGAEPRAAALADEPFWGPLTETIDWAGTHTASTIFSCLAAHAAVLHLDGVTRRRHTQKIFGVFDSVRVSDHPLLVNTERVWRVPHSRWNDLEEADLTARGYQVLSKSQDAGVDLFVKSVARSLFVFIQTHPEYDHDTLLREYRRDVTRYHGGQQTDYPRVPRNYFDHQIAAELDTQPDPDGGLKLLQRAEVVNGWRPMAVQLYRNWLHHLRAAQSSHSGKVV
jgi:homoserine O-succinyltransferase